MHPEHLSWFGPPEELPQLAPVPEPAPITTFAEVLNLVDRSVVNREDAILFYFAGHGKITNNRQQFQLGQTFLDRPQLEARLRAKGARLTVLMTDSCALLADLRIPENCGLCVPGIPRTKPLIRRLFRDHSGFLSVNSCQPGQVGLTYPDQRNGSLFTRAFTNAGNDHLNDSNPSYGWDRLIEDTTRETNDLFKQEYADGHKAVRADGVVVRQRSQNVHVFVNGLTGQVLQKPELYFGSLGVVVEDDGQGVVVSRVFKGSPAQNLRLQWASKPVQAGVWRLEARDRFISYANQEIENLDDFRAATVLGGLNPLIKIGDATGTYEHLVTLVQRPPRLGVWFDVRFDDEGAKIDSVIPGSPATRLIRVCNQTDDGRGQPWFLEPGDIITRVDGQKVKSHRDVVKVVFNPQNTELRIDVKSVRDEETYEFIVDL